MTAAITRGFCRTKDSVASLQAYGVADKAIYQDGRGAETFEWCFASFRGRPGTLFIAPDLRVFGDAKKHVAVAMDRLELAHIRVIDIIHPQDKTISAMTERSSKLISGYRFTDRRRARSHGSLGGKARGIAIQQRRDDAVPREFVERVVANRGVSWPAKLEILGPAFSEPTLRRHYAGEAP